MNYYDFIMHLSKEHDVRVQYRISEVNESITLEEYFKDPISKSFVTIMTIKDGVVMVDSVNGGNFLYHTTVSGKRNYINKDLKEIKLYYGKPDKLRVMHALDSIEVFKREQIAVV